MLSSCTALIIKKFR